MGDPMTAAYIIVAAGVGAGILSALILSGSVRFLIYGAAIVSLLVVVATRI